MWKGIKRYKDDSGTEWIFIQDEHGNLFTKSKSEYDAKYAAGKADKPYSDVPMGTDPNKGMN